MTRQPTTPSDPTGGELELDRRLTASAFAARLRAIADYLEDGKSFRIQVAGRRFRVPADVDCSIEVEQEGDRVELELQLSWAESPPVR